VNFAYEAGLQEKFPPVPLLKSYLEDSKKTSTAASDNSSTSSSGQSGVRINITALLKYLLNFLSERAVLLLTVFNQKKKKTVS
jgi:hypothetical protein